MSFSPWIVVNSYPLHCGAKMSLGTPFFYIYSGNKLDSEARRQSEEILSYRNGFNELCERQTIFSGVGISS